MHGSFSFSLRFGYKSKQRVRNGAVASSRIQGQRMEKGSKGKMEAGERIVQYSFAVTLLYIPPTTPISSAFP